MSDSVTMPSLSMGTLTVFDESLVRDTHTHRHRHGLGSLRQSLLCKQDIHKKIDAGKLIVLEERGKVAANEMLQRLVPI